MATTSKNLRYPISGDAVNINADMQNLATDVDTVAAAQTFGATAVGDIIARSSSAQTILPAPSRRVPGSSTWGSEIAIDSVITANSSATNGVEWSTAQYPNRHLIASTAISNAVSGTLFAFSAIPQSFKDIEIVYSGVCNGTVGIGNNYIYLSDVAKIDLSSFFDSVFTNIRASRFGQDASSISSVNASTSNDFVRANISTIAGTKTLASIKICGYSLTTIARLAYTKSHLAGDATLASASVDETLYNLDLSSSGSLPFPIGYVRIGVNISGGGQVVQSGTISLYGIK